MTKIELKIVLKLHHDWKVENRITYATLLMQYTDGKILSIFESAAAEAIYTNRRHGIYGNEINWGIVYMAVTRFMARLSRGVSDGEI